MGSVEVVRVSGFLSIKGNLSSLEVSEHVTEEILDFSDVVNVEVLSGLRLNQLVVNWEDLVGVSSFNTDSEEGVDDLDERWWDNTEGLHFEFVEDV